MFTTIRKAALATTAALTLFAVVAPAEAARNDAENQDKAAEAAKDGASKAADAANAADTAAAADAIAAKGAPTEAARGLASKAGYAAVAAANKAVDASLAASNATIRIAKATGSTTAWTYASTAASKTVDASIATANAATKLAKATGSTTAIQAKNVANASVGAANGLIKVVADAGSAAAPHVIECTGNVGSGAKITTLQYLKGTNKGFDSKSGETLSVQAVDDVRRSVNETDTSGDPAKWVCETIGKVGTKFVIYGGEYVLLQVTGPVGKWGLDLVRGR